MANEVDMRTGLEGDATAARKILLHSKRTML